MEKTDYKKKIEEIKALLNQGAYDQAAEVADHVNWSRCKDNISLSLVGDVYEMVKDYEKAKDVLTIAYERSQMGRRLAYRLCLLSVKLNDFDEAKEFYLDFIDMAPKDSARYILQYRISKALGVDEDQLIDILKAYLEEEMDDRWAYELAKLYAAIGRQAESAAVCDEIYLWFNEGKYVTRALQLKASMTNLTEGQERSLVEDMSEQSISLNADQMVENFKNDAQAEAQLAHNMEKFMDEQEQEEEEAEEYGEFKTQDIQFATSGLHLPEFEETTNVELSEALKELPKEALENTATLEELESLKEEEYVPDPTLGGIVQNKKDPFEDTSSIAEVIQIAQTLEPVREEMERKKAKAKEEEADRLAKEIKEKLENKLEEESAIEDTGFSREDLEEAPEEVGEEEEGEIFMEAPKKEASVEVKSQEEIEREQREQDMVTKQVTGEISIREILEKLRQKGIISSDTAENAMNSVTEPSVALDQVDETEPGVALDQVDETEPSVALGQVDETELSKAISQEEEEVLAEEETTESEEISLESEDDVLDAPAEEPERSEEESQPESLSESQAKVEEEPEVKESVESREESQTETESEEEDHVQELDELSPEQRAAKELFGQENEEVVELSETDLMDEEEKAELRKKKEKAKKRAEKKKKQAIAAGRIEAQEIEVEEKSLDDFDIPESPEEGRYFLAERYKPLFETYLKMTGMEHSIAKTIYNLTENYDRDGSSKSNNMLVVGEDKSGKTTLATNIIKVANRERGRKGRKIARVNGNILNKKGILRAMPRLIGSDLIIENAGAINRTTWVNMIDALQGYTDEMIVVMEDDKSTMERLIDLHPDIETMFPNYIELKEYDINEWVDFATTYAKAEGYLLDDMGTLSLYAKIDEEYGMSHGLEKEHVMDIVDRAIDHNRGRGLMRLIKKIFGRKKMNGYYILHEKDFD